MEVQDSNYGPYEAYKEEVDKFNKIHRIYTKMTRYEREQIYKQDWRRLSDRDKKFYIELSKIAQLKTEYRLTQTFYKSRIEKIKYDSSSTFNELTIREAITEYVSLNPARVNRNQNLNSEECEPGIENNRVIEIKNENVDSDAPSSPTKKMTDYTSMIDHSQSSKGWVKDTLLNPDAPAFAPTTSYFKRIANPQISSEDSGSVSIPSNAEYELLVDENGIEVK